MFQMNPALIPDTKEILRAKLGCSHVCFTEGLSDLDMVSLDQRCGIDGMIWFDDSSKIEMVGGELLISAGDTKTFQVKEGTQENWKDDNEVLRPYSTTHTITFSPRFLVHGLADFYFKVYSTDSMGITAVVLAKWRGGLGNALLARWLEEERRAVDKTKRHIREAKKDGRKYFFVTWVTLLRFYRSHLIYIDVCNIDSGLATACEDWIKRK